MIEKKKTFLSASRIKTAQQCSWTYWCKYILKLPDKSNDGASKGWICHLIFEVLGNPRHQKYIPEILNHKSIWCVESIAKMVQKHARRLSVNDAENLEDINKMTLNGLNYDFFGEEGGELDKSYSEKDFNLSIDEDGKKYNIRGFIDKLFLYKDKTAIIRDFKTSKQKFKGKEITDNMQDLMYCLAVKKLFPQYKSISEFLFLKFDLEKNLLDQPGPGRIAMDFLSDDVLEGFEFELSSIQNFIDHFDEQDAKDNFAADQGYPKDGTFGGPLACGKDGFKMSRGKEVKDKEGKPIRAFICAFRKPFDYYVLLDEDGNVEKSVYKEDKDSLKDLLKDEKRIEKRSYEGCPKWQCSGEFEL